MMGETANIQRMNIPYAHIIVLRYETPYYLKSMEKQKDKIPVKVERIEKKDLEKYLKLAFDIQQAHKPYIIGILLVDIDESSLAVTEVKPESIFDSKFAELMNKKLSISNLFNQVKEFAEFYISKV
ncbi:MAG: hypothetical protein RML38_01185 [Bacteroidia bacterium]|nr:hypothetical protein [Bacteroidia bacterium]